MKKAGGIIAVIGGVVGLVFGFALFAYAFPYIQNTPTGVGVPANEVGAFGLYVAIGVLYLVLSIATIKAGAVAMRATNRVPGFVLMVFAVVGAVLDWLLVAKVSAVPLFTILALVGGVLAVLSIKKVPDTRPQPPVVSAGA